MQAEIIYVYYLWCSGGVFVYVHSVKRASKSARSCVSLNSQGLCMWRRESHKLVHLYI